MDARGFAVVSRRVKLCKDRRHDDLETERLTLRPLVPADAEAYAAMRFHPEVAKWLPPPGRSCRGGASARSSALPPAGRSDATRRGACSWSGRLIGHGGLNYVPEFDETEVLWALHPDAWGKGYATEVARAALAYGFDTLGLDLIFAITLPDNRRLAGGDEAARPHLPPPGRIQGIQGHRLVRHGSRRPWNAR